MPVSIVHDPQKFQIHYVPNKWKVLFYVEGATIHAWAEAADSSVNVPIVGTSTYTITMPARENCTAKARISIGGTVVTKADCTYNSIFSKLNFLSDEYAESTGSIQETLCGKQTPPTTSLFSSKTEDVSITFGGKTSVIKVKKGIPQLAPPGVLPTCLVEVDVPPQGFEFTITSSAQLRVVTRDSGATAFARVDIEPIVKITGFYVCKPPAYTSGPRPPAGQTVGGQLLGPPQPPANGNGTGGEEFGEEQFDGCMVQKVTINKIFAKPKPPPGTTFTFEFEALGVAKMPETGKFRPDGTFPLSSQPYDIITNALFPGRCNKDVPANIRLKVTADDGVVPVGDEFRQTKNFACKPGQTTLPWKVMGKIDKYEVYFDMSLTLGCWKRG